MAFSSSSPASKPPRSVFETIYAFAPNRDTLGGTAYLIVDKDAEGNSQNLLVDAPPWDETTLQFLAAQGGVRWLMITHRTAIGKAAALQKHLGCEVVIQEQEAYLLPDIPTTTFQQTLSFIPHLEALWTPGYSPGSACLYCDRYGGVLFTGRHLLPNRQGQPEPLRFSKTFHWPRHLRQVEALKTRFSPETLAHLCPAANTGFLRGQRTIANAYAQLQAIDLETLRTAPALI
ncbi:MAG: MBL fold metallo-hydrolase [Leptolyngbya sp.]|nr:MBL fold metallo-hydrolase [Leptolyngbya sp.]